MSLLRSFVLTKCSVSIVDTSSDHSTSIARWTRTPPISRWPATASTISSHPSIESTSSGTVPARKAYDKRTPGLFKIEWCGDGFIGLCSKTYYCFGATDKSTTKGLNKRQNIIDKDAFLNVLTNRRSGGGFNRGFRVRDSSMMTYVQERAALTYFYPKRKVLADGLSTAPLDL